ncbi:uncharacterized protein LOC121631576 [Melanotaenia boesemani]|uniref:uncharacterized protein LOC121631576 n=1 Tax=Melanotaenia boesemani TaxID=1250792 RepID=UPI001C046B97|nr:uncharacterized protein LOC121631576 [Melanotaenia boesemani]
MCTTLEGKKLCFRDDQNIVVYKYIVILTKSVHIMKTKDLGITSLDHLCVDDRERYSAKLTVFSEKLTDPFKIADDLWVDSPQKWPPVQYGDIYNYLINTPGIYTTEAMKAYKSLDGYNFFVSGHVGQILYHSNERMNVVCFLKCAVMPSQKITDKKWKHQVWIYLEKLKGYVVSAHCTCKAGGGHRLFALQLETGSMSTWA